jgi:hypothetical protein
VKKRSTRGNVAALEKESAMSISSLSFVSAALTLSLVSVAGCVADDGELELSTEEQALIDDDNEPTGTGGSTTSTIYPMMSVDLVGISAEMRFEDSTVSNIINATGVQEIYGSIAINNLSLVKSTVRNLGTWGNPWLKSPVAWGHADGGAPKKFDTMNQGLYGYQTFVQYAFKDTKLCASNTYASCQSAFAYNNQVAKVPVRIGDTVRIDFHFMEYDEVADDQFCKGSITGTVAKDSYGVYFVKNASGSKITTANGTGLQYGPFPYYTPEVDGCKLWFDFR